VVVEVARRRWATWGDSAAAEFVEGQPRVPETPSKPKRARPYTGNLTGRADVLNRLPETAWTPAYDGDGEPRDGVDVAELTAEPDRMAGAHARHRPPRSAAPRRAAPAVECNGRRITCFATNTSGGQLPS
jgi:hypothetical protein